MISLIHVFASPLSINGNYRFNMSKDLYQNSPKHLKPLLLVARVLAYLQRNKPVLVDQQPASCRVRIN